MNSTDTFETLKSFYKTTMCRFFKENKCSKGDSCTHAHNESELIRRPTSLKTRMCKATLQNIDCINPECEFSHDITEIRQANNYFKTKMCEFYVQKGFCKLGNHCKYAHSEKELDGTLVVLQGDNQFLNSSHSLSKSYSLASTEFSSEFDKSVSGISPPAPSDFNFDVSRHHSLPIFDLIKRTSAEELLEASYTLYTD